MVHCGGKVSNQAYAAAWAGASVAMVGKVISDHFGPKSVQHLAVLIEWNMKLGIQLEATFGFGEGFQSTE